MFCKVVVWTGFTFASLQSTLVAVNARSLFKSRLLTLPLRTRKPFLGVYVKKLFSYIVQGSFFSSPANCTSEGSGRQFYSTDCAVATYLRHGHTRLILDDGRQYPPSHKSHMRLDFDIATVPSSFFYRHSTFVISLTVKLTVPKLLYTPDNRLKHPTKRLTSSL